MKVAKCHFCEEGIKYVVDLNRTDGLGQWRHMQDGKRKCCEGAEDATPESGTVKRTVEDVHVTGGRV